MELLEVGTVIEAIVRLEFEDGLKKGVLPGGCWFHCTGTIAYDGAANDQFSGKSNETL